MRHYLINPTWRCPFACSYCWVEASVRGRPGMMSARERPMQDWADAINRDRIELVDVAGGEPLLVDWVPSLFAACPGTTFGLSTNGHSIANVKALCKARPRNLCAVNLSLHPERIDTDPEYLGNYADAVNALRAARLPVHVNVVDAPGNEPKARRAIEVLRSFGIHVAVSPYEDVSDIVRAGPCELLCDGGITHLNIAPDGEAWPCLTTMRSQEWVRYGLGNWLDGPITARPPQPCKLYCADFYILPEQHEAGDMWRLNVREVNEGSPI